MADMKIGFLGDYWYRQKWKKPYHLYFYDTFSHFEITMYQLPTFLEKSKKKSIIVTVCTCRYQLTALNNDHCLVKSCDAQRTIPITKLASIFKLLIDVNGIKLLINDVQTMIFCFFQIMLVCLSQL